MSEKDGMTILIDHKWNIFAIIVLFVIGSIFIYVVLPLSDGIVLGLIFAYIGRPIKKSLEKKHLGSRISSLIATIAIVTPLIGILGLGMIEVINQLIIIAHNQPQAVNSIILFINEMEIPEPIYVMLHDIVFNLSSTVLPLLGMIPFSLGKWFLMFSLNSVISVFVCFFLLKDGSKFVNALMNLMPDEKMSVVISFMDNFDRILGGIFMGSIYTAIITGTLSIFVFYFFEVPHILAMSSLILLAALVPIIAGWMVLIPITIYRYFEFGFENAAIFLIVSTLVLYIPTDLLFKPYFVSKGAHIHPLLIMLAFIGGGLVGGIGGFFLAPIFLGILIASYRAYVDFEKKGINILKVDDD
jgi:predicted PurR-regulated permease PerM